jgi:hypothetical protein
MKTFIAALTLVLSLSSQAKSVKIYEDRKDGDHASAQFQVNKELGRAWVLLTETTYGEEGSGDSTTRIKVPGLSFDAERSMIVFENEGQIIDCAEVYNSGRSIFRMTKIRDLNCSLTTQVARVSVDDGFEIKKQVILLVFLNVV